MHQRGNAWTALCSGSMKDVVITFMSFVYSKWSTNVCTHDVCVHDVAAAWSFVAVRCYVPLHATPGEQVTFAWRLLVIELSHTASRGDVGTSIRSCKSHQAKAAEERSCILGGG